MAPIAGWYDDPRDHDQLRYWDGAAWTEHVTTKQPEPPAASSPTPVYPGAAEAQRHTWQYGQPAAEQGERSPSRPESAPEQQQPPSWPAQQSQQTWPPQQPWPPQQSQQPWPPQQPWPQPQQPWPPAPGARRGVTTPDGAQVTTWVKRFAARLLDVLFVVIGTVPLTGYFMYRAFQILTDQMNKAHYDMFAPSSDVIAWETTAIAIIIVAQTVYEAFSLRRWGATPGKRLLGISVRRWEQGGQLPWSTIARRVGFLYGLAAISIVPVVGIFASIAALLNYLFPLWDKRRQALHDKVASTVVIEGARVSG
jgi:uncharacterized RDD family membrane protein YckC